MEKSVDRLTMVTIALLAVTTVSGILSMNFNDRLHKNLKK